MIVKQNTTFKTRFTIKFLISLSKIKRAKRFGLYHPESEQEIRRRSYRIKIAAYSSMAYAVGSKRAWSRALLLKLRNRARIHGIFRNGVLGSNKKVHKNKISRDFNNAYTLRTLVPGGTSMKICGLLEETAHYIKCLSTQVKVMQSIVDQFSM